MPDPTSVPPATGLRVADATTAAERDDFLAWLLRRTGLATAPAILPIKDEKDVEQ